MKTVTITQTKFECPTCGDHIKICPKCKIPLPLTEDFFYKDNTKNGFYSWCKACHDTYRSARTAAKRALQKLRIKQEKQLTSR